MTWAIILRRWCNLDQNDAQSADCPHDIQGANFPAAWKFNGNWQKNLEFGALYQIKSVFFFSPFLFCSPALSLVTCLPTWQDHMWHQLPPLTRVSAGVECGAGGSRNDSRASPYLPLEGRVLTSLSGLKCESSTSAPAFSRCSTKWWEKKGLKFRESAVEYFSWIRHNCWRRILLERRYLNAPEET